jgi:hypothetical protein
VILPETSRNQAVSKHYPMIRSKYGLSTYTLLFVPMGMLGWGLVLLYHSWSIPGNGSDEPNSARIGAILLLLGAFIGFRLLFNLACTIQAEPDRLSVRHFFVWRRIPRTEIKFIDLLSRSKIYGGVNGHESITIGLKSGENLILLDTFYRNMPEIKRAIRNWYQDIVTSLPPSRQRMVSPSSHVANEAIPAEKFSGNFFTGVSGILFFGMSGFFLVSAILMIVYPPGPYGSCFLLLMGAISLCYIFFGADAYYFIISEKYLLVKNHLFFWYHWLYPISDITAVVIERPYQIPGNGARSNSLLIRNSALASTAFPASSLRNKDWEGLGEKMKSLGIEVMNEIGTRQDSEN